MTFAPIAPTTSVAPTKIASDTYVIHQVQPALGQPLFVYINSWRKGQGPPWTSKAPGSAGRSKGFSCPQAR